MEEHRLSFRTLRLSTINTYVVLMLWEKSVDVMRKLADLRGLPLSITTDNGREFAGKIMDECLNKHWFLSMRHAREIIENWRKEYNEERPHSSLKDMTRKEFTNRCLTEDSTSDPH